MAVWISGLAVELREVVLRDKPAEMLEISPKGTVPVLLMPNGAVLEESLDIMRFALAQNDPEGWLAGDDTALIGQIDGPFKHHLDRYKYHTRYDNCDPLEHRAKALAILQQLNTRLAHSAMLCGTQRTLADIAIFPFIRQFANASKDWFAAQDLSHLHNWLNVHLESLLFKAITDKYPRWTPGAEPIGFGGPARCDDTA